MKAAFFTHRGSVRSENQDALFVTSEAVIGDMDTYAVVNFDKFPTCLAVIDGMGGCNGGAEAARILTSAIEEAAHAGEFGSEFNMADDEAALREIMLAASNRMSGEANVNPELREMGATFAGVLIREKSVLAFNCGDCRAYRISHGALERLTRDHSVVQELFGNDIIGEDEMRSHPRKNIVTSAVSADLTEPPELYVKSASRWETDEYFICSDGVWETLPSDAAAAILQGSFPNSAESLRNALMEAGCRDNISFIWSGR